MKISKVINHGRTRFRVDDPRGPGGKRKRLFFDTLETAKEYATTRKTETAAFGNRFKTIPLNERASIVQNLQRLDALGWTLTAAVDFIEQGGKSAEQRGKSAPSSSSSLGTVADEFLAAKDKSGLRSRYVKTLRASINWFLLNRRNKAIADVTPAEIQEYITSNGW